MGKEAGGGGKSATSAPEATSAFDDLVAKLVQYLTSDPGVDRFRVDGPRLIDEDQRLTFQARVYDATLQPQAGADIALTLQDSTGTAYDYRFSATAGTGYALDAGRLAKGPTRGRPERKSPARNTTGAGPWRSGASNSNAAADRPTTTVAPHG